MFWKNSLDVRLSLFLRVAFWNPFSGANFCFFFSVFLWLVVFSGVLPMFLLYVLSFRCRTSVGKILLMSGLLFS